MTLLSLKERGLDVDKNIVITPDINTKKNFYVSISVFIAIFMFSFLYMKEMIAFGISLCLISLVLILVFTFTHVTAYKTVTLSPNGCRFDYVLGKEIFFGWDEMFVSYCENNPRHPGSTLCGPGLIISHKQIPQKIRISVLDYYLVHAPFSSVFVRFSWDGEDNLITFHRGGFSFKGHSANKETLYSFFELHGIPIDECLYTGPKSLIDFPETMGRH